MKETSSTVSSECKAEQEAKLKKFEHRKKQHRTDNEEGRKVKAVNFTLVFSKIPFPFHNVEVGKNKMPPLNQIKY